MKKEDLGAILLKLQNCDAHDNILKNLNELSKNRPFNQTIVFNSYSEILNNHSIPIMHLAQAKFFHGNIISFDLASLYLSTTFINTKSIFFYASSVPWMDQQKPYSYWHKLLNNQKIQIIAKNSFIYDIYSIMWKQPLTITEELSYDTIKDII